MVKGMWKSRSTKRKLIKTPGGTIKVHKRKAKSRKALKKKGISHNVKSVRRSLIRKVRDEND